jgi:hypothetical protein
MNRMKDRGLLERWDMALKAAQVAGAITFESVSERPIDIVMAVLLDTDPDFRQWMASQILGSDAADSFHLQAAWGVCYAGEADMVWFLIAKDQRIALMFENKINCGPQESQHERYLKRGEYWKRIGLVDAARSILFSPRCYRSVEAHKYDVRLSYEAVRDWLDQPSSGMRMELSQLLSSAVNKPQGIWGSVPTDNELLDWIRWIYDLKEEHFPNLWIVGKRSTGKGGKVSAWIERSPSRLGPRFTVRLKFGVKRNGDGYGSRPHFSAVDLHINGAASRSSLFLPEIRKMAAGSPLSVREPGKNKSLAIG